MAKLNSTQKATAKLNSTLKRLLQKLNLKGYGKIQLNSTLAS
jgi:hypothetical protein